MSAKPPDSTRRDDAEEGMARHMSFVPIPPPHFLLMIFLKGYHSHARLLHGKFQPYNTYMGWRGS